MGDPIQDPLNVSLPEDLHAPVRTIFVTPRKMSTFRLMHDPFDSNRDRWFSKNNMPRVTDGNEVKSLIRGEETYEDMAACMRAAAQPDPERKGPAFIYLAGWDLNGTAYFGMPLQSGDSNSKVELLFKTATTARVEIRAMAWAN